MQRILVIDDDVDILITTQKILQRAGYDVFVAQDGEEGLELFDKIKFDLVITDMIMPKVEGVEVIRTLKKKDSHVKIVAISGGGHIASEFYLRAADRFRVDMSLQKPIQPQEFVSRIKEVI